MDRDGSEHRPAVLRWRAVVATGIAYYLLAVLMWQIDSSWGSAFWPAAGVTFAVLVRSPRRSWPVLVAVVALAELTANLQFGTSLGTALCGAAANSAEPLIGAAVFTALTGQRRLCDLGSLGAFLIGGVLAGPAVGAVFGGLLPAAGSGPAGWLRWFVGDGVGVIAVAPALLAPSLRTLRGRIIETVGLTTALAGAANLLVLPDGVLLAVSPYLAVPVLLWGGLRFGAHGAAVSSTVIATVVHAATATGHGPFVVGGRAGLVVAQTYIGIFSISALALAVLVNDLEARRRNEQALLHRALHDPLTGLPNRSMLELCLASDEVGAVIAVDLDHFKPINDAFGHDAGDYVLREVASRLQAACRPTDLVARTGGDEFVVLLRDIVPDDVLADTAARLESAVRAPLKVNGTALAVGASIGTAPSRTGADSASLLREADQRMYEQKHRSRAAARRSGTPGAGTART